MMIPPSSTPRASIAPPERIRSVASWSPASPVSAAKSTATVASSTASSRLSTVPTRAAPVFSVAPWASTSVAVMITLAPINVAASGLIPERIAGTMKRTITRMKARDQADQ